MALRRLTALLLLLVFVSGISIVGAQAEPLKVVATYSILGDIVQNIAGDNIELTVLVGPDGDSHVYEPTPQDAIALSEADLIFENGFEFETWLDDLYASSGSTATRVVVSDGIEPLAFEEHEEDHDHEAEEHAHDHEEVVDLGPWVGEWVSTSAFEVDVFQPAFDAVVASTPELSEENVRTFLDEGYQTSFDTFLVADETVTFTSESGSVACDYTYSGTTPVLQVAGEVWSIFETSAEACAEYRYLLLNPPHAVEAGASLHFHMIYGSSSPEEIAEASGIWVPALYPVDTDAAAMVNMWVANARSLGLYIAAVNGIEAVMTEEEQAALASATGGEAHDHEHEEDEHGHEHGEHDPHIWHDPNNGIVMVEHVRDALVAADPDHAADYEANAKAYTAELAALDTYIREQVAAIPEDRRILVTSHDTFGYFGDEYGFEISSALESVSTEAADPSAGEIAELVEFIQAEGVPAIFAENIANPDLMQRIADEAGVVLVPTLYTDALGQPGTPGATYLGLLRYNIDTIAEALQ